MIQRIQTVYWLLAVLLAVVWFFFPYASIEVPEGALPIYPLGLRGGAASMHLTTCWGTAILGVLTAAVPLFCIFAYRRAAWQIRGAVISALLSVGLVILEAYYVYACAGVANGVWRLKVAFWLPLLAAILSYAGLRGALRDRAFLRRMDRLR